MDERAGDEYIAWTSLGSAMPGHAMGMNTHRDGLVIAFDKAELAARMDQFTSRLAPDSQFARFFGKGTAGTDSARKALRSSGRLTDLITPCLYRPFDVRYLLYHPAVVDRPRHDITRNLFGRTSPW